MLCPSAPVAPLPVDVAPGPAAEPVAPLVPVAAAPEVPVAPTAREPDVAEPDAEPVEPPPARVAEPLGVRTDGVEADGIVPAGVLTEGVVTDGTETDGARTGAEGAGAGVGLGVGSAGGFGTAGGLGTGTGTGTGAGAGGVGAGGSFGGAGSGGVGTGGTGTGGVGTGAGSCAPAGSPVIPIEKTNTTATNHHRRRIVPASPGSGVTTVPSGVGTKRRDRSAARRWRTAAQPVTMRKIRATRPRWMTSRSCSCAVGHADAVDEGAVGAAVVEDPHALAVVDDDRVAARDALVLEAQVGREATSQMGHRLMQRNEPRDLAVLDREVAARCGPREGQAVATRAVAQDAVRLELLRAPVGVGRSGGRCAGHGHHPIARD